MLLRCDAVLFICHFFLCLSEKKITQRRMLAVIISQHIELVVCDLTLERTAFVVLTVFAQRSFHIRNECSDLGLLSLEHLFILIIAVFAVHVHNTHISDSLIAVGSSFVSEINASRLRAKTKERNAALRLLVKVLIDNSIPIVLKPTLCRLIILAVAYIHITYVFSLILRSTSNNRCISLYHHRCTYRSGKCPAAKCF